MDRLTVGQDFCGWQVIRDLYDAANGTRNKLLVLTLFKTGGRVSEVLDLTKSNILLGESDHSIVVKEMKVLKKFKHMGGERTLIEGRYKRVGGVTVAISKMRTFPILKKEELTSEWVELIVKQRNQTLFYGRSMRSPMSRKTTWALVVAIGKDAGIRVNDHWFRGMRSTQLQDDYGFGERELDSFFGWGASDPKISNKRYGGLSWRGLEFAMLKGLKLRQEIYGVDSAVT